MNPDSLVPFNWELLWFSLGALMMGINDALAIAVAGVLFFGGLAGSIVRNYDRSANAE